MEAMPTKTMPLKNKIVDTIGALSSQQLLETHMSIINMAANTLLTRARNFSNISHYPIFIIFNLRFSLFPD
jgi:hypothetical protein